MIHLYLRNVSKHKPHVDFLDVPKLLAYGYNRFVCFYYLQFIYFPATCQKYELSEEICQVSTAVLLASHHFGKADCHCWYGA